MKLVCWFIIAVFIYSWANVQQWKDDHPWLSKLFSISDTSCVTYNEAGFPNPFAKPKTPVGIRVAQAAGEIVHHAVTEPGPSPEEIQANVDGAIHQTFVMIDVFTRAANGYVPPEDKPWWKDFGWMGASYETPSGTCTCPSDPRTPDQQTVSLKQQTVFTAAQKAIARAAVGVANERNLPEYAKVIILAAGGQESTWQNLNHGPDGSLGWLQLIPANGTVAQRMNPAYEAGWFFDKLVKVSGWQSMSVTQAAQAVQRSGYPDAYAKWEDDARSLLALVDSQPTAECASETPAPGGGSSSTPASWDTYGNPRTVQQALAWYAEQVRTNAWIPVNTCEEQVRLAYGWKNGVGIDNPLVHWNELPTAAKHTTGEPPAGALVYWRTEVGHIAVSAGQKDGVTYVYSSDAPTNHFGLVPISKIDSWGPRIGWSPPFFPRRGSEMVSSDVAVLNLVPFPKMPAAEPVDPLTDPRRWKVAA